MAKTNKKNNEIIAGFLTSALDMEDEMGQQVYGDFLKRRFWPDNLDETAFKEIELLLAILINETAEHEKTFSNLREKLNKSDV